MAVLDRPVPRTRTRIAILRRFTVLACLLAVIGVAAPAQQAHAAAPAPVSTLSMPDPGAVLVDGDFHVFATGAGAPHFRGDQASGPWVSVNSPLTWPAAGSANAWAVQAPIWAPDAARAADGSWVLFYSAKVDGLADSNQRCIGLATGPSVDGPFTPTATALSCPPAGTRPNGQPINATDQPVTGGDGLIDPSPFTAPDGQRYVLYKSQRVNPDTSLYIVPVDASWTRATGPARILRSFDGQIENPTLVYRGGQYVLFASKFGYQNCSYATVYWKSGSPTGGFSGEQTLLTTGSTGICGPGGADITPSLNEDGDRMFLHGWVCGSPYRTPCTAANVESHSDKRRVLYAAVLRWSGSTPSVEFL